MAEQQVGEGHLEQVRDILFGGQLRDIEQRFARMEESLQQDLGRFREDTSRSLAALEESTKHEIGALAERLRVEQKERRAAEQELANTLKNLGEAMDRQFSELEEQQGNTHRASQQHLLERTQELRAEIHQRYEEVSGALRREAQDLRGLKAGRSDLAGLFADLALRLNSETPPEK